MKRASFLCLLVVASATATQAAAAAPFGDVPGEASVCTELRPHLRVAVAQDLTRSSKPAHTPRLNLPALRAFIDALRARCGSADLVLAIVRADVVNNVQRLPIGAPPVGPPASGGASNPFIEARNRARYRIALDDYRIRRAEWTARTDRAINLFLASVTPLLMRELANRTELYTVLRQMNTFLSEPAAGRGVVLRYLLALTDGEDNIGEPLPRFDPSVVSIVVNGIGKTGVLSPMEPMVMADPSRAFDFILQHSEQ